MNEETLSSGLELRTVCASCSFGPSSDFADETSQPEPLTFSRSCAIPEPARGELLRYKLLRLTLLCRQLHTGRAQIHTSERSGIAELIVECTEEI